LIDIYSSSSSPSPNIPLNYNSKSNLSEGLVQKDNARDIMKPKHYFPIIIILLSFNYSINSATIKGIVSNSRTKKPLAGADVILVGKFISARTDNNGFYIIKDLSPGKYIISTSDVVYKSHRDTVNIKGQDEVIELNIMLKPPIVDLDSVSTPQLEAYHEKLREINNIKPVMLINIDSLTYSEDYISVYLTMINNTVDSIYIFKNYPCFNVIAPIITDSNNKLIDQNMIMIDCVGEKTCPDSSDLILIKPGRKINYPVTKLMFYNFSNIPKGNYSVEIKYEFKKPVEINTHFCHGDIALKILTTGLRGAYTSTNILTFNNL
jgi:hypothetical protein